MRLTPGKKRERFDQVAFPHVVSPSGHAHHIEIIYIWEILPFHLCLRIEIIRMIYPASGPGAYVNYLTCESLSVPPHRI